ncbi:hypothetical protein GC173_06490 [bacterium]|nr:hypothetical protein [bacterium]
MNSHTLSDLYAGSRAVLATMHGKESVICQPFRSHLRLHVVVPEYMNTDRFGTFTAEVPRGGDLIETARRKALEGMATTGLTIGLASEGECVARSGGGYEGHEVLLFIDADRKVELMEERRGAPTSYGSWVLTAADLATADFDAAGFPSHRLTVRPNRGDLSALVFKGIGNERLLEMAVEMACENSDDGRAFVESDMRAHRNPTRMRVISELAERLALRIAAL